MSMLITTIERRPELAFTVFLALHFFVWTVLPEPEFRRYGRRFFELAEADPKAALFPEALLQSVDDEWLTLIPSEKEAFVYFANPHYVRYLMSQLGTSKGKALERLAGSPDSVVAEAARWALEKLGAGRQGPGAGE